MSAWVRNKVVILWKCKLFFNSFFLFFFFFCKIRLSRLGLCRCFNIFLQFLSEISICNALIKHSWFPHIVFIVIFTPPWGSHLNLSERSQQLLVTTFDERIQVPLMLKWNNFGQPSLSYLSLFAQYFSSVRLMIFDKHQHVGALRKASQSQIKLTVTHDGEISSLHSKSIRSRGATTVPHHKQFKTWM